MAIIKKDIFNYQNLAFNQNFINILNICFDVFIIII